MLYLYHGSTSVCAIKVRLVLEEKRLPWSGEILNLQAGDQYNPDYLKLNPSAVVPTLLHDGRIVIESTLIMEYLEEAFAQVRLMPADLYQRHLARLWMKKVDAVHPACGTITAALAFRRLFMRQEPDGRDWYVSICTDPAKRARLKSVMDDGLAAPAATEAARAFQRFVDDMEADLQQSEFLAGQSYSLADTAALPYINRAEVLCMEGLWSDGRRPGVSGWLARMRERPTFAKAVTAYWDDDADAWFNVPREETWLQMRRVLGL